MRKTKKFLLAILATLTAVFCALGVACGKDESSSTGETETLCELEFYSLDNGSYGVKAGKASALSEITIPATYNGKKVSEVLDNFFGDNEVNTKKVIISDGIEKIADNAFKNCSSLTSITIPDSVTSIADGTFYGCSSLTEITIPFVGAKAGKKLTDTYQYPFGYIFGTNSYTGSTATKQCYFGATTSVVTWTTYYLPTPLKKVTVTGGIILHEAFKNCTRLTSITLGNGVTDIGQSAFVKCSSLTSVTIPDSVTSIGQGAFGYCSSLTSVTLPNSLTSIDVAVFRNCPKLTSITIPSGVTSIGNYAFAECTGLKSVTLPNSVTSIGIWAFEKCSRLTSITFDGTKAQWNDIEKGACWRTDSAITKVVCKEEIIL